MYLKQILIWSVKLPWYYLAEQLCHVHVYMSVEMTRINMEQNLKLIIVFVLCFLKANDEDICFLLNYIIKPYRTLNYKAQKFAMVLSSLDIAV